MNDFPTLGTVDIIDDDESLRESLADLLRDAQYQARTWENAETFLHGFQRSKPMTIISDVRMHSMSGIDMHRALTNAGHTIPVIYISGASTLNQGIEAFRLGAVDFLTKPFSREVLLQSIESAISKDRLFLAAQEHQALLLQSLSVLSPREREVFNLLIKGCGNAEITNVMKISLPTAKQYKSQIMNKLNCRSLSDLIKLAEGPI